MSAAQPPSSAVFSPRAAALPAAIGLFAVYSAMSVYSLPLERPLFGLILVAALVAGLGRSRWPVPPWVMTLALLWVAVAGFYLLVSLLQPYWSATYAAGDLALSLLPLLSTFAFVRDRRALTSTTTVHFLLAATAVAAFEAQLLAGDITRFTPPSSLLIAGSWYFLIQARTGLGRVVATALTAGVGYLAFASGYRTHVLLWLLAPVVVLLLAGGWRRVLLWVTALVVAGGVLTLAGHPLDLTSSLADSRFETILGGQQDVSLDARFSEVRDVLDTADSEWAPGQDLFGGGFGASYVANESNIARNIGADGRVHNIHIGPVLVLFRYGLLGLAVIGCLLVFLARTGVGIRRGLFTGAHRDVQGVLWCAMILFLVESLTLNATVDPLMSYALGGLLALWAINSAPRRDAAHRGHHTGNVVVGHRAVDRERDHARVLGLGDGVLP